MRENKLNEFDINLHRLSNDTHLLNFSISPAFFESFEQDLIKKGDILVNTKIEKSELLVKVTFDFKGTVALTCDRSLEVFNYNIDYIKEFFIRFGEENAELDENLIQIKHGTEYVNLAQYMYEFLILSLPAKKLHPKFNDEEEDDLDEDVDGKLVFSTNQEQEEENKTESTDPRWDALNKLKEK